MGGARMKSSHAREGGRQIAVLCRLRLRFATDQPRDGESCVDQKRVIAHLNRDRAVHQRHQSRPAVAAPIPDSQFVKHFEACWSFRQFQTPLLASQLLILLRALCSLRYSTPFSSLQVALCNGHWLSTFEHHGGGPPTGEQSKVLNLAEPSHVWALLSHDVCNLPP